MRAIYRYGRPIELTVRMPGELTFSWEGGEPVLIPVDEVRLRLAQEEFARDLEHGIANTEQYQVMSPTFRYDPHYGVVPDFPF